jgi:hypothetical protein
MAAMRLRLRLFLLLPLAALLACASGSPSGSAALFTTPSGDWVLNVAPQTGSAGSFSGNLSIVGANVTGVVRYYNPGTGCVSGSLDIPVTGSINAAGTTMTLTTGSFAGSVATFTLQLPLITASKPNFANGTAVISGGSCALASSALVADYVDYSGTFTGTLSGTVSGPVTLQIPSVSANADGQFPVNGASLSFVNSTCGFTVPNLSGLIAGFTMQLSNGTVTVITGAASSPISIAVAGGACTGSLTGTVALQ